MIRYVLLVLLGISSVSAGQLKIVSVNAETADVIYVSEVAFSLRKNIICPLEGSEVYCPLGKTCFDNDEGMPPFSIGGQFDRSTMITLNGENSKLLYCFDNKIYLKDLTCNESHKLIDLNGSNSTGLLNLTINEFGISLDCLDN